MKFDLHIHSRYSYDSFSKPEDIVKTAKKLGLNGIAIVDHGSIKGALEAQSFAGEGFTVIIGEEVYTKECELIGLFLKEEIRSKDPLEVINEIKEQGGLVVLPHPYKRASFINEAIIKNVDAIEAFNARSGLNNNEMALELAEKYALSVVCGSDAHFLFEIGRSVCTIDCARGQEEIKQAILLGKTKIGGMASSIFFEYMSQLIKMFKLKNPALLLRSPGKLYRLLFK